MSYPAYVIAPTKATWENGYPLPPQYLSMEADAKAFADATGGALTNGVDFFKPFGISFVLDPADPRQPWVVTLNGSTNFAGLSLVVQNGPNNVNGGGVGNPGSWQQDATTKQWGWVPKLPPPPPVVVPASSAGDAQAFAILQGATTLTTQQFEQETLYWLRAIGSRLGIQPPPA